MSIYLIDYENVHDKGLTGIKNCIEGDLVYIFYTKGEEKLPIEMVKLLNDSKAKIKYIKAENGSKNALDFQLSSYLGYLISKYPKEKFQVISGDKGYEVLIKFWSNFDNQRINIQIDTPLISKNTKKTVIKEELDVKGKLLKSKYKDNTNEILTIIDSNKSKLEINNALCKAFESKIGGEIYNVVKPFLKDKTGDVKK